MLVFVADSDGEVIERCESAGQPSAFGRWLEEQADRYEREHPTTRVPFVRADVTVSGEGEARRAACAALDEAREGGAPVLVYVGRASAPDDDKKAKALVKACRKLERTALDAESAAEAAEGVVLLRLDVADEAHALLAKQLGADKLPTLLLFVRDEEPQDLGGRVTGQSLAHKLKSVPRPE